MAAAGISAVLAIWITVALFLSERATLWGATGACCASSVRFAALATSCFLTGLVYALAVVRYRLAWVLLAGTLAAITFGYVLAAA
jgi:hypothetical protein